MESTDESFDWTVNAPVVAQPVVLSVAPDDITVGVGQSFSVDIVLSTGTQVVDGFSVELAYDPTLLQIDGVLEQATTEFPLPLGANFLFIDNTNGILDYSRGSFGPSYPSGTITLATVTFTALAPTAGTPFSFVTTGLTATEITAPVGISALTGTEDANIEILNAGDLVMSYTLQGRSGDLSGAEYGDNFDVSLYQAGTSTLVNAFPGLTGMFTGELTVPALPLGSYDVLVKHSKYLARLKNVTIGPGTNLLDLGQFLTGDADDNNAVSLPDFSVLSGTFQLVVGNPGFDSRADFNADGGVTLTDFSLLSGNFQAGGASAGGAYSARVGAPMVANKVVDLAVVFDQAAVAPGEYFTAQVMVQAGAQAIDGAEAHLRFDPERLEVTDLALDGKLNVGLLQAYDNAAGTIDLAAGTLGYTLNGELRLATITLRAKQPGEAALTFEERGRARHGATVTGRSVLDEVIGASVSIESQATQVVDELAAELGLSVYPIPSEGRLTAEVSASAGAQTLQLRVYNDLGQVVLTRDLPEPGQVQLDLTNLAEGVYRVQLTADEKAVFRTIILD